VRQRLEFAEQVTRSVSLTLRPARPGETPALGSISGRVEDEGGAPAPGALVTGTRVWRGGRERDASPIAQVVTGGDGRFELGGLEEGRYRLVASREGLAPATGDGVQTGTRDLTLRLAGGGAVVGSVRSRATGDPVAPFTVVVSASAGLRRETLRTVSVLDPSGRFAIDGLPPGAVSVLVAAADHAPEEQGVEIPDPGAPPAVVEFTLREGARIEGTVRSRGDRHPLEGAQVAVDGPGPDAAPSPFPVHADALTDAAGRFELGGLGRPPVSLFVAAPGYHGRIVSGLSPPEGGLLPDVEVELTALGEGEEPQVELGGIGAVLSLDRGRLTVVRVIPGSGAAEVGLAEGDRILRVEGQPVGELGYAGAVERIRGPEGTAVTLEVVRGTGAPAVVAVPRRLVRS
jgi:hypothetical protein